MTQLSLLSASLTLLSFISEIKLTFEQNCLSNELVRIPVLELPITCSLGWIFVNLNSYVRMVSSISSSFPWDYVSSCSYFSEIAFFWWVAMRGFITPLTHASHTLLLSKIVSGKSLANSFLEYFCNSRMLACPSLLCHKSVSSPLATRYFTLLRFKS